MKNDLLLRVLQHQPVPRPPVWMMRQAGRYLPDFMKLKRKYSFFERCKTPELACEITMMPIEQVGVDAAILFSDILVIPLAMGMDVQMVENKGPVLPSPIQTAADVDKLQTPPVEEALGYVYDAIKLTKQALADRKPLLGFAGTPWTILCYMVEGGGSKGFEKAKSLCYREPEIAHKLLDKLTDYTIEYLKGKIEAGVDAIQIFDSWGSVLSPASYKEFSEKYITRIVEALAPHAPVIVFAKGCWHALPSLSQTSASALSVDWTTDARWVRDTIGDDMVLQGNLDPTILLTTPTKVQEAAEKMLKDFGTKNYIANLGHGILPHTPVENAKAFIEYFTSMS